MARDSKGEQQSPFPGIDRMVERRDTGVMAYYDADSKLFRAYFVGYNTPHSLTGIKSPDCDDCSHLRTALQYLSRNAQPEGDMPLLSDEEFVLNLDEILERNRQYYIIGRSPKEGMVMTALVTQLPGKRDEPYYGEEIVRVTDKTFSKALLKLNSIEFTPGALSLLQDGIAFRNAIYSLDFIPTAAQIVDDYLARTKEEEKKKAEGRR